MTSSAARPPHPHLSSSGPAAQESDKAVRTSLLGIADELVNVAACAPASHNPSVFSHVRQSVISSLIALTSPAPPPTRGKLCCAWAGII